ncbi:MAG: 8-amino-7-oxononanoate synthase [Candidatus Omnitrophota bacterium]
MGCVPNFSEELNELRLKGLERKMRFVSSSCGRQIIINGKKVLNFCSNNYLGLADDSHLKKAAISAINKFGIGSGASRLVSGSNILHKRLEEKLADFKKQEACLVYPSGYSANLGIIPTLADRNSVVFCDRLNHASIIDGIILSRAELARYPHKDTHSLEELLKKNSGYKNKLIISDSVFSMDGDIAPLPELSRLAEKYDCLLMVDEAHSTGVLGKSGRGILEHFGLKANKRIIQMGTLSKAMGGLGGFVCGSRDLIDYLVNRSRSFIFTTALPAANCASALEAIRIIEKDRPRIQRLKENADFLRDGLRSLGFDTLNSQTPIIPILTQDPRRTMELSQKLFEKGIFVQGIRPPAVPDNLCRLRVTAMATHTKKDLEFALSVFKEIR